MSIPPARSDDTQSRIIKGFRPARSDPRARISEPNRKNEGLQSLLKKLVKGNFIEAAKLEDRLPGYAAAVELSVVRFPSRDVVGALDTEIDHVAELSASEGTETEGGETAVDGEAETLVDDRIQTRNVRHPDYVESEAAPGGSADGTDETEPAPAQTSKRSAIGESHTSVGARGSAESPAVAVGGARSSRSAWIIGLVTLAVIVAGLCPAPRLFGPVIPESLMERRAPDPNARGSAFGLPQSAHMLWSFQTGGPVRTTPCVEDGLVFFGSGDGRLYTADRATGKIKSTTASGGFISSPTVIDGLVLFGSQDGHLYAFIRSKL